MSHPAMANALLPGVFTGTQIALISAGAICGLLADVVRRVSRRSSAASNRNRTSSVLEESERTKKHVELLTKVLVSAGIASIVVALLLFSL
jgi:hypothetical protein